MSKELTYKIFSPTGCLSEQQLFDYKNNKLTTKEQHMVEKHLLDCEFCSDALEGISSIESNKAKDAIKSINEAITKRVSNKKEAKIVPFNYKSVISIAAAVLFLIGGVFFFNYFMISNDEKVAEINNNETAAPAEENEKMGKKEEPSGYTTIVSNGLFADSISTEIPVEVSDNEIDVSKDIAGKITTTDANQEELDGDKLMQKNNKTIANNNSTAAETKNNFYYTTPPPPPSQDKTIDGTNKQQRLDDQVVYKAKEKEAVSKTESLANAPTPIANTAVNTTAAVQDTKESTLKKESKREEAEVSQNLSTLPNKTADNRKGEKEKKKDNTSKYYRNTSEAAKVTKVEKEPALAETIVSEQQPTSGELAGGAIESKPDFEKNALDSTYTIVEEMPKYPGGEAEMIKYLQQNISADRFQSDESDIAEESDIKLEFTITKEGKAINPKVLNKIDKKEEKALLEKVNNMPLWEPGKQNGKKVDVKRAVKIKIDSK